MIPDRKISSVKKPRRFRKERRGFLTGSFLTGETEKPLCREPGRPLLWTWRSSGMTSLVG